jgi:hypothetical protein
MVARTTHNLLQPLAAGSAPATPSAATAMEEVAVEPRKHLKNGHVNMWLQRMRVMDRSNMCVDGEIMNPRCSQLHHVRE